MQKSYFFLFVLLVFGGALSHPVEAVGQEGRRLKIVSAEMDSLAINDSACGRNATLFSPRPEDQEGRSGRKPAAADSA